MPLKTKKGCITCALINSEGGQRGSRLFLLINDYHVKKITLTAIHEEYRDKGINYLPLRNHAIKHQHPSAQRLISNIVRDTKLKAGYEQTQRQRKHSDLTQEIIDRVLQGIESGEISLNATQGLAAAKLQATVEEKQKDRTLQLLDMVYAFAADDKTKGVIDGTVIRSEVPGFSERASFTDIEGEV
jgi:hypothetical protein